MLNFTDIQIEQILISIEIIFCVFMCVQLRLLSAVYVLWMIIEA